MSTTRRDFITGAVTAAGAAAVPELTHASHSHDHEHQALPSDPTLRVKALESLLVEKGLVDPAALDALVDGFEHKLGPRNGARVVARAWVDGAFKQRLLADATAAIAELGFASHQGERIVALENTPKIHNLIVCTLCSCYPWPLLGLPPRWYKSAPYRSRAVIDSLIGGQLCAILVLLILQKLFLTAEQMRAWGWRIPFVIGAMLALIALKMRSSLHETEAFIEARTPQRRESSIRTLLKYPRQVLIVIGLTAGGTTASR